MATGRFRCEVFIRPRADILDPQGDAVQRALEHLGFEGVTELKVGRYLTLFIGAAEQTAAEVQLRDMCDKLLANPIIEDYEIKVAAE
jgi:phosphoribosylformylglycinamidine synthase PurS subunit